MKLTKLFISMLLMLSFANSALAASKKKKKSVPRPEEEVQLYSLPVQQSEIKLIPVAPIPVTHDEFEITGSTWAPKNFQLTSNVNVSETLNLFSLRLGAEYAMNNVLPWSLEPAFVCEYISNENDVHIHFVSAEK